MGIQILTRVVIGRPPEKHQSRFSYVDNDNEALAEQVTQFLLELGHENILFLNSANERTVSVDRQRGYQKALLKAGVRIRPELHVFKRLDVPSVDYGYQSLKDAFANHVSFSAVMTDTDKVALGVYRAAAELGISIPDDISVIAFSDDSVFAPEFNPPLSGVSLNSEELGREAAELLIERIRDNSVSVIHKIIPAHLVVRESCRQWTPPTNK
jgi:DNA-binding LacI/PurR family transcriptional regulator